MKLITWLPALILMLILLPVYADSFGYFEERQRGYYFYEDPVEEEEVEKEPSVEKEAPTPAKKIAEKTTPKESPDENESSLSRLKGMGKEWEEGMALAILEPNLQNVREWMTIHNQIIDQASAFSNNVKETVWVTPEFDSSLQIPRNSETIMRESRRQRTTREAALKEIAKEKGLLYVFRSDCPYCARFSPLLVKFAEQYGFSILSVTLDGKGTPEFPSPKAPNAFIDRLNVDVVPAVYIVDPTDNRVVPAAFGFTALSDLEKKIEYASKQFDELDSALAVTNKR